MRLHYWLLDDVVRDAGTVQFEEDWYDAWLQKLVSGNDDLIFFITTDTTDVWPEWELTPEIDYTTVVMLGNNNSIHHTYDPACPPGCSGWHKDCIHNPKGNVDETVRTLSEG